MPSNNLTLLSVYVAEAIMFHHRHYSPSLVKVEAHWLRERGAKPFYSAAVVPPVDKPVCARRTTVQWVNAAGISYYSIYEYVNPPDSETAVYILREGSKHRYTSTVSTSDVENAYLIIKHYRSTLSFPAVPFTRMSVPQQGMIVSLCFT